MKRLVCVFLLCGCGATSRGEVDDGADGSGDVDADVDADTDGDADSDSDTGSRTCTATGCSDAYTLSIRSADSESLTVQIARDDLVVVDERFEPSYETFEPNGPGCGTCTQGGDEVVIEGT